MKDHRAYIRKETAISAVINIAIGAAFFILLFRGQANVPLWGTSGLILDCVPQGFMVGLMSVLPPCLITRHRLRNGLVAPISGSMPRLPRSLLLRALMMAVLTLAALTALAALLASAFDVKSLPFTLALVLKALVGGVVALLVTPPALRAELTAP